MSTMDITIPCEECLIKVRCKYKGYVELFTQCVLLREYLENFNDAYKRNQERLQKVYNTLTPTEWYLQQSAEFFNRKTFRKGDRLYGKLMVRTPFHR